MALAQAFASIRSGVIRHAGVPISSCQAAAGGLGCILSRSFAEGTYLNKSEVTDRILNVVKHFDKIEPGKVIYPLTISIISKYSSIMLP